MTDFSKNGGMDINDAIDNYQPKRSKTKAKPPTAAKRIKIGAKVIYCELTAVVTEKHPVKNWWIVQFENGSTAAFDRYLLKVV